MTTEYIAIHDKALIARGDLETVVRKTKAVGAEVEPYVLEWETCKRIELNWHGDVQAVIEGLPKPGPTTTKRGRPKLGVVSKEVTLLPRHWEWLATQRGGASVTLRRLVDHAMKNITIEEQITLKQNQLYALMSIFADEVNFEEATRALYRLESDSFHKTISSWPEDIQALINEKFISIEQLHQGRTNDNREQS